MISVVLAAYKGEKYIVEQVKSILLQLGKEDELIISDDYPQGETYSALYEIIRSDSRVKYIIGEGRGLIKNFENAVTHSCGDYIFLSDQDDVWLDGKVQAVMLEFEKGADVVMHDAIITDEGFCAQLLTDRDPQECYKELLSGLLYGIQERNERVYSSFP